MTKKITLINPPSPWLIGDRVELPLGLLYLAGYTRAKGADVNIIDLSGNKYKEDYDIPKSDYFGIGFTSPQFVYAVDILKKVKQKYPKSIVIAGGIHPTALPEHVLDNGFDVVVRGEGERSLSNILKEGVTKKVYPLSYVQDLDSLPFPAYDLINMESYLSDIGVVDYMKTGNDEREINIMGSRGCNFHCAFCTSYKGGLRQRSVENVLNEVQLLQDNYNVNRFFFVDDNFIIDKKWVKDLSSKLKENNINWHILARTDEMDYNTGNLLRESGCMGIDFGVESGSQKILNIIKKEVTVEQQELGLKIAHDTGLKTRAQMMIGLPQETEKDFNKTLEFISRNNKYVDKWGIHIFVPFPSSEIWNNPKKFKYSIDKKTDFSNFQTIGKPGEWNFVPKENQQQIAKWRDILLNTINKKNIYVKNEINI